MLRRGGRGELRVPVSVQSRDGPVDAAAVWQELHGPLLGFILRRVRDRDVAEDVLQEVMLRIHRHAGELEHSPAVGAWVHRIASNAIVDHYRHASVRRELAVGIDLHGAQERAAEPTAHADLRGELAACIGPLLDQLSLTHRQALVLTELEGLTQTDAAAQLGLSTSGMKSRVQRARHELRDLLVACCEIELDRRTRISGYRSRGGPCPCSTRPPSAAGALRPVRPSGRCTVLAGELASRDKRWAQCR